MNKIFIYTMAVLACLLPTVNFGCSSSDCPTCCSLEETGDWDLPETEAEPDEQIDEAVEAADEIETVDGDESVEAEPEAVEEEQAVEETEDADEVEAVDETEAAQEDEDALEQESEEELEAEAEEEMEPPACSLVHTGLPLNAACVSDDQCVSGLCLEAFCSADCSKDSTVCGPNQVCNKEYGFCIPNKINSDGYPDFGTHDSSLGLYAPCFNNDDCYGGRCFVNMYAEQDTPMFFCTLPCKDDESVCDCGFCNAHDDICVPGGKNLGELCSQSSECKSMDCEEVRGGIVYCTRECSADADCEGGKCVTPYEGATYKTCASAADANLGFGDDCYIDWQCGEGVCYAGKCNFACESNEQCPTNFACAFMQDAAARRCAPASDVGNAENGDPCVLDYNCKSGYCKTFPRTETYLYLYDVSFQEVASDTSLHQEYFSRVTYSPPTDQLMHLYVSHYTLSTGPYLLLIQDDSGASLTEATETEPNDYGNVQLVNVNSAITAEISDTQDVDWYKFNASAGKQLTITTTLPPFVCADRPVCPANDELMLPLATTTYNLAENAINWDNCFFYNNDGFERSFDVYLTKGQKIRVKAAPHVPGEADLSIVVKLPCQAGCLAAEDGSNMGYASLGAYTFESLVFTAPDTNMYTLTIESGAGTSAATQFELSVELDPTTVECDYYNYHSGCCLTNNTVRYCDQAGLFHDITCVAAQVCQWPNSDTTIYYTCGTGGLPEDPNGAYPRSCSEY